MRIEKGRSIEIDHNAEAMAFNLEATFDAIVDGHHRGNHEGYGEAFVPTHPNHSS